MSDWTIATLAEAIRARQASPVEVTQACLDRIARLDGRLRAFITLDAEGALRQARALEAEQAAGRVRGPLHGVPMAWKDLCHTAGLPTSCGTLTRDYFTAEHECTAVVRLTRAGAITLGKLNMTELALGPFGDNAHTGDPQNPWRAGHVSGGSSSGTGVAVAAGLALGGLGTDTGGSIRLPAAACGIVGIKPTYGRVSRAGVMPLSWSLDHIGPMARTVLDTALMLQAVAGRDPLDPTTSARAVPDYAALAEGGVAGLRVGVADNHYFDGVAPEVVAAVRAAVDTLGGLGAVVKRLIVPDPRELVAVCNVLARAESAAVHARILAERPQDLQPAVRARLEVGLRISAHDYLQALRLRGPITRRFIREVFAEVDVLATPTIPEPAPALAGVKAGTPDEVVERMGRFSRLTRPFNGLGLPALTVPCGFSSDGRPLALHLAGRPFEEGTLFRAGLAYERATDWHRRRPDRT